MASSSAVDEHPDPEEHVFEEDIVEETVWDEEGADNFLETSKKMEMVYDESQCELATETVGEEYQEVDVEEYDESVHDESYRTNLPDLLSKKYHMGNDILTLCFSKRGSSQIALNGYLYNFSHSDGSDHTWVCINPECTAIIITDNEMSSHSKENNIHSDICEPDDAQLRLRISIYDLRLMVEYTDVPLGTLYDSFAGVFARENPDLADLFPSFNALHRSLDDHRRNKLYRRSLTSRGDENGDKQIEEDIDDDDENLLMGGMGEEVVEESYAERVPMDGELAMNRLHLYPYGRTRGFPPTFCVECGIDMPSHGRAFTPQHSLVQHVSRMHQPVKIHTFVFEAAAFEMWLREVQRCPALRFRRFSLIGEDMYYLCSCDMRLSRSKYTQPGCCTAYIKIAEYRVVSQREARLVSIEYSFEHFAHDLPMDGIKPPEKLIADLRPEDFLYQMERRKQSTANLVRNRLEMNSRRYSLNHGISLGASPRYGSRVSEHVFSASRSESRSAITRQVATSSKLPLHVLPISVRPAGARSLEPPGTITRRVNFKDQAIFESVRQFEQLSHIVIRRLQNVKSVTIADHYSEIMRRMVNRIVTDMECAPEGSAQSIWCGLNAPRNGRNPALKRAAREEGEGDEDGEQEGEEETEGTKKKRKKQNEEETEETAKVLEEGGDGAEGEGEGEDGEEAVKEGEEPIKEDSASGNEKEKEKTGVRTRGRSQLPVKSTLLAAGRVSDNEKEKTVEEEKQEVPPQATKRKSIVKETTEKSVSPIRSKSSRIQARKGKIEGEMEEKKT